jgi:aminoglycoside 3-N-acetyltransferase
MAARTPAALSAICRDLLPSLLGRADGKRMLADIKKISGTDRWNSFDRFHQTTQTLASSYEEAGAAAEVFPVQTGGQLGSGRWIIHQAADVYAATAEVVAPVRRRILDWNDNPWHAIQWTASTPKEGLRTGLVILDTREEIEAQSSGSLRGQTVLTCMDPRALLPLLADRGAAAVIADKPVDGLPEAVAWTKFGWGGVPMGDAAAHLVGLAVSQRQGEQLRALAAQHDRLELRLKVDGRKYVGSHDVVSGIVRGADDTQDEVWVLAHSGEPGALDNASGVSLCLEAARLLEGLIAAGTIRRPRRSIRFVNAYECYGFFAYLERQRRLQTPLAGVCIDTVGARPEICDGRIEWRSTVPSSAGFVDWVGETVLRATLKRQNPGYRLAPGSFVPTADTLIGDPQYGYPCPWINTHGKSSGRGFDAYHTSADIMGLLSPSGLEVCTAAMATYLYFLADAGSREVGQLARAETQRKLDFLAQNNGKLSADEAEYTRVAHRTNMRQMHRWLWGGTGQERAATAAAEKQVASAAIAAAGKVKRGKAVPGTRVVPRRTALLSPDPHNTPVPISRRISAAGFRPWALFWADGKRDIAEIARLVACEESGLLAPGKGWKSKAPRPAELAEFFAAHAELGYVELLQPQTMLSRSGLVADLRALGVEKGMDLMVHSSLSAIGAVQGGADAVVDALLSAVGPRGTLLMPSFNHRAAQVFNPQTTPTTNGAIPDCLWRRPEAVRSMHPTHAVAAIGPQAQAYCAEHLDVGIWDQRSPIGKLVHGGGYILALGTTHMTSTAYHVAEMSMPCGCIDSFANMDRVVMADGQVKVVQGLAFRAGECPVSPDRLDQSLDRRRLQRRGKVGAAGCELVEAKILWQVRREHLKKACPGCTVKPAVR